MAKTKRKKGRTPPMRDRRKTGTQGRVAHGDGVTTIGADDGEPMPPVPEGAVTTPFERDGEKVVLNVPTPALAKVLEIAAKEGVGGGREALVLPFEAEKMDVSAQHRLAELTRVTNGHEVDFVRAFCRVFMEDERPASGAGIRVDAWQGWLDLPTRYVGMMIEAAQPRERSRETVPQEIVRANPGIRPRWAGSWTFDRVYDNAHEMAFVEEAGIRTGEREVRGSAAKAMAVEMLHLLRGCHLVRVESNQMDVLPEWDDLGQAFDYAHDLHLPFEPLFLEFEGAGGVAPTHVESFTPPPSAVTLRGAMVSRDPDGALVVAPFGDIGILGKEADDPHRGRVDPYFVAGRVMFGSQVNDEEVAVGPQELVARTPRGDQLTAVAVGVNAAVFGEGLRGEIVAPYDHKDMAPDDGHKMLVGDKVTALGVTAWAGAVLSMGLRVLAALSIMESDIVVVEDAPMERRDRKRADSRGWEIAQQVYLRPVRKGPRSEPTGNERNFSHRFWVRGHTKHFGIGTRMAAARPDLVKPCTRVGAASCGMCRRVWTPPFVKGPEDKPLVMKSLVKRVGP